jgi:OOP family OmpA-OmpF porin
MRQKVVLTAVLALVVAGLPAMAQEGFAGASWLGSGADFETAFDDFDSDDSGWKIFVGYDFIKFFGLEAAYRDLGDFSETSGAGSIDAEVKAYDLAGRGVLPLGKAFELFGKLGYSTVDVDATTSTGLVTASASDSDWELYYGVGIGLKIGKSFGIRAEWEEWDVDTELNAYSLGAYIRFGGK